MLYPSLGVCPEKIPQEFKQRQDNTETSIMLPYHTFSRLLVAVAGLGALIFSGAANAVSIGPSQLTVSSCDGAAPNSATCIDIDPGQGIIPLDGAGLTPIPVRIDIDFDEVILLRDPGETVINTPLGQVILKNPWTVSLTFNTSATADPVVGWPNSEDGALVFTGFTGADDGCDAADPNLTGPCANERDLVVNAIASSVDAAGDFTFSYDLSREILTNSIEPGLGFSDFHMIGLNFNMDGPSTLELTNVTIDPSRPAGVPEPGTLAILSLGLLGLGVRRRRKKV